MLSRDLFCGFKTQAGIISDCYLIFLHYLCIYRFKVAKGEKKIYHAKRSQYWHMRAQQLVLSDKQPGMSCLLLPVDVRRVNQSYRFKMIFNHEIKIVQR